MTAKLRTWNDYRRCLYYRIFSSDIQTHFLKLLGKFYNFLHFLKYFLSYQENRFFATKHAGLQRTLKLRFSHQRGTLEMYIPHPRGTVYDLYDIKLSFYA